MEKMELIFDSFEVSENGTDDISSYNPDENGRFPANLLVCDDALNNGIINRGNNKPSARVAGALQYFTNWIRKSSIPITISNI